MSRKSTLADYNQRMLKVLEYLQQHLDSALAPTDLARIASFSPYHFQRIFRGMMGESVMGHISRLRLERAASRLVYTDRSVTTLAFEAGYTVHEAFTRAFGARFGCSPSEFRKQHRRIGFPPAPNPVHYDSLDECDPFPDPGRPPTELAVKIENQPPRAVAYVRHVGRYSDCGSAWERLMAWVASSGHMAPGNELIGVCYDDPDITDEDRIRYEACAVLSSPFEAEGDVGKKELFGGDYAVVRHRGPYADLSPVYRQLMGSWLPRSGREAADAPCLERYWNDPDNTPPEELETDIMLPLWELP